MHCREMQALVSHQERSMECETAFSIFGKSFACSKKNQRSLQRNSNCQTTESKKSHMLKVLIQNADRCSIMQTILHQHVKRQREAYSQNPSPKCQRLTESNTQVTESTSIIRFKFVSKTDRDSNNIRPIVLERL